MKFQRFWSCFRLCLGFILWLLLGSCAANRLSNGNDSVTVTHRVPVWQLLIRLKPGAESDWPILLPNAALTPFSVTYPVYKWDNKRYVIITFKVASPLILNQIRKELLASGEIEYLNIKQVADD